MNNSMNNIMNNSMSNIYINGMNPMYQNFPNNMNLNYPNNMFMNFPYMNNMSNLNNINNLTHSFNNMSINNNINYMSNQNQMNNFSNFNNFNNINNMNIFNSMNNNFIFNENIFSNNNINEEKEDDETPKYFDVLEFPKTLEEIKNSSCCVYVYYNLRLEHSHMSIPGYSTYNIGFFCQVSYLNEMHKLLITNINANAELNDCSYINCYYHEDINKIPSLSITLDKSRHIYLNKKYNILIVEIKNENENVGNYFEYDFDNSEEDINTNIKKEKGNLLCLLSLKGKSIINMEFLFGNLNEIKENEINSCNFNKNCFGSPIINLNNNKLIGIFTSLDKAIILDYFLEEYFMNKNNANLIGRAMIYPEQFNFKSQ